jgi:hypothetical protein
MGFSCSGEWKKAEGVNKVWLHKSLPFAVSNPHGYMVVVTNGDMDEALRRIDGKGDAPSFSGRAQQAFASSPATFYLQHPATGNGTIPFNREKVPLDEIVVTASGSTGARAIYATFAFSGETDTRVFVTSLKTFVVWIMRTCGISDFTRRIAIDEKPERVELRFVECTDAEIKNILGFAIRGGE